MKGERCPCEVRRRPCRKPICVNGDIHAALGSAVTMLVPSDALAGLVAEGQAHPQ